MTDADVFIDGEWVKRSCADCRHRYVDKRYDIEVCLEREPVLTTESARRGRCTAGGVHWEAK